MEVARWLGDPGLGTGRGSAGSSSSASPAVGLLGPVSGGMRLTGAGRTGGEGRTIQEACTQTNTGFFYTYFYAPSSSCFVYYEDVYKIPWYARSGW